MLDNKKSNLSALGIGVVTVLGALGVIDEQTRNLLLGLFTGGAVYGLRDGMRTEVTKIATKMAEEMAKKKGE